MPEASLSDAQSSSTAATLKKNPPRIQRIRSFGSFLLALYVFVGVFLTLFNHGLWYESMTQLGNQPSWVFHLSDAFIWSVYAILSFLIIFLMTDDAKTHASVANVIMRIMRKKSSRESIPIIAALLNIVALFVTDVFYMISISSLLDPTFISFTVINAGIVGVATYYYVAPPVWEMTEAKNDRAKCEALKLEHDVNMSLANSVIWATIIIIASVYFIIVTQVVYPSVDVKLRATAAFTNIVSGFVVNLTYLTIGIWVGILGKLWDNALRVRKEISKLEFGEEKSQ